VPASTGTGIYRHRPALPGLDRYKTGTDRPGLFYDLFDKNFQIIISFWAIQYKMSTKNIIKQPRSVDADLVPVQSGQGWSVPVPVALTDRKKRCVQEK
jgi:hypothetical protein